MKKLLAAVAVAVLALSACDTKSLKERLDQHDKDIAGLQGDVKTLKDQVTQMNANIAGLQAVVDALQNNVYVKSIADVKDMAGKVIGYTITFTDNKMITIYHGEDGAQGETGPAGPAGSTPVIGVKEYDGVLYWTVNGEFLLDSNNKLVPATGKKGETGSTGNDGKTPQLRIKDGNWEVSYDGETWTVVGPAQTAAEAVDAVFKGVKETKDQVVFTLADGSKLFVDKLVDFSLNMKEGFVIDVVEGATTEIPYTLSGVGTGTSRVDAVAGGDWWAEVEATDKESGVLKVTAGASKKAKVIVYAVDGKGRADMRALVFNGGTLNVSVPATVVPAAGGDVVIPVVTNVDYEVEVEEDALSWISYVVTKVGEIHDETLTLTLEKNNTPEDRSGKVELKDRSGAVIQTIVVNQDPGAYTAPVFADEDGFKKYIMTTKGYDTDKDGILSASEAKFIVDIDIPKASYYGFSSFAGIEAFYNLKSFKYASYYNKAESIDLSSNSKLEVVELSNAYGSETKLTTLDLSNLRALKSVQVGLKGSLATIKLGNVPQLKTLIAYNTSLASIDVTGAPALENLTVYGTKLTTLDASKNTKLETLNAGSATLAEVILPGAGNTLKELKLDNAVTSVSGLNLLTELTRFDYNTVPMAEVDLSNCAKLTTLNLGATNNKALKKVDVRKAVNLVNPTIQSTVLQEVVIPEGTDVTKWGNVTKQIYDEYYETYKAVTFTFVPVEGGEEIGDYLAGIKEPFVRKVLLGKFDKNNDDAIDATEAKEVKELDFSECGLMDGDLAGLEVFPVEKLILSGNKFTTFDAAPFASLKTLVIDNNRLVSIGLSDVLETLDASHNAFKANPLPASVKLKVIDLSYNQITSINGLQGSAEEVNVSNNALSSLSLYGSYNLKKLDFSNNQVTSFGAHNHSSLVWVNAADNQLTTWSFKSKQETLDFTNNNFTQIDISSVIGNNALKSINLTGNKNFNLVIVGAGNSMPEGLEIIGVEHYNILNATNPTSQYQYNTKGNIKTAVADEKAEFGDITLNYSLKTKGFSIKDGGKAHITVKAGKERLIVSAVASDGNPTITISRSTGKVVLTKDTDQSYAGYGNYIATGSNPWTPALAESAKADWASFIVNGDGNKVYYHLTPYNSSSDKTVEDEEIIFTVAGGDVVIYGLEIENLRWDTMNM